MPYGEVSEFFAPEVSDPTGQGRPSDKNVPWTFRFYTAGQTDDASYLIDQGETSAPGQKLTMVLLPTDPDAQGASVQVFADNPGPDPSGSGFSTSTVPTPAAGQALVLLNAAATRNLGTRDAMPGYVLSNLDGTCTPYYDPLTGKLHDDPHIIEITGGTQSIPYLVNAGEPTRVARSDPDGQVAGNCRKAPVVQSDTALTAGARAYGFIWGTDPAQPKLTVVPVG